jgi:molybdopterin-binding protein
VRDAGCLVTSRRAPGAFTFSAIGIMASMLSRVLLFVVTITGLLTMPAVASDLVLLHAAGSLRGALTEVAEAFEKSAFEKSSSLKVEAKFGPSARGFSAPIFRNNKKEFSMKISARNQLKGTITDIVKGATTSHVRIDIGGGVTVTASITNEAVDDLKLAKGKAATAVIKASDVMVGVD